MGRDRRGSNHETPAWASGLIFGEPSRAKELARDASSSSPKFAAPLLPPTVVPTLQSMPTPPMHTWFEDGSQVGCSKTTMKASMPYLLPELRMAPPESIGGEKEIWRLPPSPHNMSPATGDRILIVKRFGMFHAFEVLPGTPECDVESAGRGLQRHAGRSFSCPAAFVTHTSKSDGFKHTLSLGDALSMSTKKPTEFEPQGDINNDSPPTTPQKSSKQKGSQWQHNREDSSSKDSWPAEPLEQEAISNAVSNGRVRNGKKGPRKVVGHTNESAPWAWSYDSWYPSQSWSSKHMKKASSKWWTSSDW